MTSESNIDRKILRCIEDGLEILGNSGKKATYYYLEKNIGLKKDEIPKKPEKFSQGLAMIFGEKGTAIIEKNLVKKLATCFDLNQQAGITLSDAVAAIKAKHEI
jgi:hypothetical protein